MASLHGQAGWHGLIDIGLFRAQIERLPPLSCADIDAVAARIGVDKFQMIALLRADLGLARLVDSKIDSQSGSSLRSGPVKEHS